MKNYRMNYNKMDAVIIGLGNVGFLFDEDPDRIKSNEIGWTHFTAYSSLSKLYNISAVIDQDFKKLSLVKNNRDEVSVKNSLENITKVCSTNDNLVIPIIEAAKNYCTLGEIVEAIKVEFGEWSESSVF